MPKHPLGFMRWDAEVTGSKATMSCANFGVPHNGNFIIVKDTEGNELLKESVDSGGAKNAVKSHFYAESDHFTETGLGQT
jgi:coenzyme F420-reducing hydrogenase beta subunit